MAWGPQQQPKGYSRSDFGRLLYRIALAVVAFLIDWATFKSWAAFFLIVLGLFWLSVFALALFRWDRERRQGGGPRRLADAASDTDALESVRDACQRQGDGAYLGVNTDGTPAVSWPQRALLLVGPPRSGKTSNVIIPSIVTHLGPVVSTSTKPDVMHATVGVRERDGRVWVFDPTGTDRVDPERQLRWSPLRCSTEWDGAQLMARAMTANVGTGVQDRTHWARRAQALLAPLLHAAARGERDMEAVVGWVMAHETDEPLALLAENHATRMATGSLVGLSKTADRERSSIFSAAADALDAYMTRAGVQTTKHVNFDPTAFVASRDTIYIHAPAENQQAVAPIVCGLLAEVRRQTYLAHRDGRLGGSVFFALDEVANIAPVEELPSMASEGGSQGLKLLAAIQDLSQARYRWGDQADGFLTLFGSKLILPGIADHRTIETISTALGEYDRKVVSTTRPVGSMIGALLSNSGAQPHRSETVSTQRTRVLSPGEIANIPTGKGLWMEGVKWQLVTLTPAHSTQPWQSLTAPATV